MDCFSLEIKETTYKLLKFGRGEQAKTYPHFENVLFRVKADDFLRTIQSGQCCGGGGVGEMTEGNQIYL